MSSTNHDNDVTFSCVDKIVIIIYFPEKRSIEILTNLWGIKGHIRSGREILSSRDSEVKIFKNIFLPQGWYNWWCIFYRSLIDEIFLKCLFCISCLYCEPFLPAPDRIRQVRKYTPSLLLLHFNSHQVSENIYLQRIRNFYELLQRHITAKVFNKTFLDITIKIEEQIVWKLSWIEVNN